jgi:hypothetical protein
MSRLRAALVFRKRRFVMTDTPLTAEDDFLGWVEAQAKADFLYSAEDLLPQAI